MCCVSTAVYSSRNRQLLELKPVGKYQIGTTACPYTNISSNSNGKLKAGIVSTSYYYCAEIGTQEFI